MNGWRGVGDVVGLDWKGESGDEWVTWRGWRSVFIARGVLLLVVVVLDSCLSEVAEAERITFC